MNCSRRGLLAASAATSAAHLLLPARAIAAAPVRRLTVTTRTIEVGGRAATVKGIVDESGRNGLVLQPGERFAVDLVNASEAETIVHWHGQLPPNAMDGVPDMPLPVLQPGESRSFDFAATPGTHWMHSHIPVQEMELLAAPLIVRRPEDVAADRQEVTVLLHDFSFRPAEEVLAEITGGGMVGTAHGSGHGMGHDSSAMGGMSGMSGMTGMESMSGGGMAGMAGMGAMDLNDFAFDAYLANDRTLDDPEVVTVEKGGKVLVRVINGSAATVFWIDTGALQGRAVAVDGNPVLPVPGSRFGLAMGQRIDVELDVPAEGGAFPILALREGAVERTGLILATPGAAVERVGGASAEAHPAFSADLSQEALFQAALPLAARAADRSDMLMLGGTMSPYVWTIDGVGWGNHRPIQARTGERVELMFHNMSMMAHPMHLHGHHFQIVALNGTPISGAVRDTVHVPPMGIVTIAFEAGEVGSSRVDLQACKLEYSIVSPK